MRTLRAIGSCYRSQVRRADKQTMTTLPRSVCVRVPPALPSPRRQKFVNGSRRLSAYLGFLQIPNNQRQDRRAKGGLQERGEGFSANIINFGMSAGAIFHKIKGPCVRRNTSVFAAAVHGEYLDAAVGHSKRLFAL